MLIKKSVINSANHSALFHRRKAELLNLNQFEEYVSVRRMSGDLLPVHRKIF